MARQKKSKHPQGGRYTPPKPRPEKSKSNLIYLILFIGLGLAGALMIILNFLLVLPGSQSGWYTIGGLVLLAGCFYAATKYH